MPAAPPPSPTPAGKPKWSWQLPGDWNSNRKLKKVDLEATDKRKRPAGQAWTIQSKDARPATPGPRRLRRPMTAAKKRTQDEIEKEHEERLKKKQESLHQIAEEIRAKNKKASLAFKDKAAQQQTDKIKSAMVTVNQKQVRFEERQRQLLDEKRRKRAKEEEKRQKVFDRKAKLIRRPAEDAAKVAESSSEELLGAVGGQSPTPPPTPRRVLPARLPKLEHTPSLPLKHVGTSENGVLETPWGSASLPSEAAIEDHGILEQPRAAAGKTAASKKNNKSKSKKGEKALPKKKTCSNLDCPHHYPKANNTSVTSMPEVDTTGIRQRTPVTVASMPEVDITGISKRPPVTVTSMPEVDTTGIRQRPPVTVTSMPEVDTTGITQKPPVTAQTSTEIAPAVKAYLIKVRKSEVRVDNVGPKIIQVQESEVKVDTTIDKAEEEFDTYSISRASTTGSTGSAVWEVEPSENRRAENMTPTEEEFYG
ncbi:MAP7 domain-containing protein 2-like [Lingula anatina]|uniref:MAP7 domain-containing protein 2-like n=1 Tax=Lingula anatina TaxID=7574 RepID=A0A1S3H1G6_LINAN|nr:MAP7 domain-containing protein 2-like [Lingula anatina]|eukprot:XP_013378984.1 MAP7 domain-containing protein 2-like [Lingula anatina]